MATERRAFMNNDGRAPYSLAQRANCITPAIYDGQLRPKTGVAMHRYGASRAHTHIHVSGKAISATYTNELVVNLATCSKAVRARTRDSQRASYIAPVMGGYSALYTGVYTSVRAWKTSTCTRVHVHVCGYRATWYTYG